MKTDTRDLRECRPSPIETQMLVRQCPVVAQSPLWGTRNGERLLKRCVTVLKQHVMPPIGIFKQSWALSSPLRSADMTPYGAALMVPALTCLGQDEVASSLILSILATQRPDGLIPMESTPDGNPRLDLQVPPLAWSILHSGFAQTKPEFALQCQPALQRWFDWLGKQRLACSDDASAENVFTAAVDLRAYAALCEVLEVKAPVDALRAAADRLAALFVAWSEDTPDDLGACALYLGGVPAIEVEGRLAMILERTTAVPGTPTLLAGFPTHQLVHWLRRIGNPELATKLWDAIIQHHAANLADYNCLDDPDDCGDSTTNWEVRIAAILLLLVKEDAEARGASQ